MKSHYIGGFFQNEISYDQLIIFGTSKCPNLVSQNRLFILKITAKLTPHFPQFKLNIS